MNKTDVLNNFSDIKSTLLTEYADRNAMITEMRELRFMDRPVEDLPVGFEKEEVRLARGYEIVENIVGTLVANPIKLSVPPASQSVGAQAFSSELERWLYAAPIQLRRQQQDDVFERFLECLTADGHGCMRLLYAPQKWAGFPRRNRKDKDEEQEEDYNGRVETWKQGRPLPFSWVWIDPRCVFPVYSDIGLEAIMERDWRNPLAIDVSRFNNVPKDLNVMDLARYRSGGDEPTSGAGKIEFCQIWTREFLAYTLGNDVVHIEEHKYPNVPYIYGMGQQAATQDVERMGLSVLFPLRYILPYTNRLVTQKASSIRVWAWPTTIVRQSTYPPLADQVNGKPGVPRVIKADPGGTMVLLPGEDVSFLVWQGVGPDIDKQIALAFNEIEHTGLPRTSMGLGGGESGYAVNQLIGAARMKLRPLVSHGEFAYREFLCQLLDLVEFRIKQKIPVYGYGKKSGWITLDPKDLKGYRNIEVALNPMLPTDSYAKSSMAMNESTGKVRSRRGAREMVGIEDPDAEAEQILLEEYMDTPEVRQAMTQYVVRKFGFMQEKKASVPIQEVIAMIQQLPDAGKVAALQAMGVPPEALGLAPQGGVPGGPPMGGPGQQLEGQPLAAAPMGPNIQGAQSNAVMAAPTVQAAPGMPQPNPANHVGPVTRPSGGPGGVAY